MEPEPSPPYMETLDIDDEDSEATLETMLKTIRRFRKYSLFYYFSFCLPIMFNGMQSSLHIFTANPAAYRCNITQCNNFLEPVKTFEMNNDACSRLIFDPLYERKYRLSSGICNKTEMQIVYRDCVSFERIRGVEYTAANTFGLLCSERWNHGIVDTFNNVGQIIGLILGGVLADIFGRRNVLLGAGFLSSSVGYVQSYSITYKMFITYDMIQMVFASAFYPVVFVLAIESVDKEQRIVAASVVSICHFLGETILAGVALEFRNWRNLLTGINIMAAIQIFFFTHSPDSVRWLLSRGKKELVVATLRRAAIRNRSVFDADSVRNLLTANDLKLERAGEGHYPLWRGLKVFSLVHIPSFAMSWFMLLMLLSLNALDYSTNKYELFFCESLMQVMGVIASFIALLFTPRPLCIIICMLSTSFFSAVLTFATMGRATTICMFFINGMIIASGFQAVLLFAAESFPANIRCTLLTLVLVLGRIGHMILPSNLDMREVHKYLPFIIFEILTVLSGLGMYIHEDTARKALPLIVADID